MTSALIFFPLANFACRPSPFLSVSVTLYRSLLRISIYPKTKQLKHAKIWSQLRWAHDMQSLSATNSGEISSPFGSQHSANAHATVPKKLQYNHARKTLPLQADGKHYG